jgi:hypothetical protein
MILEKKFWIKNSLLHILPVLEVPGISVLFKLELETFIINVLWQWMFFHSIYEHTLSWWVSMTVLHTTRSMHVYCLADRLHVRTYNSTPRPLYLEGKKTSTHWRGGSVGPRISLENMEKWKFFHPPGLKLQTLGHPACSHLLYRLCYPGSFLERPTHENW